MKREEKLPIDRHALLRILLKLWSEDLITYEEMKHFLEMARDYDD